VLDTPRVLRTNVKKCIDQVLNEEDDDDDFGDSDDDSCYTESDDDNESVHSDVNSFPNLQLNSGYFQLKSYSTDDYFDAHVSTKVMTSNHSLNKLKKPQLDQDTIQNALQKAPKKHEKVRIFLFRMTLFFHLVFLVT
jgi:hypothetical protein